MKWYYYLNNEKEDNLLAKGLPKNEELIICWQQKNRRYALFPDYHAFIQFQGQQDLSKRCFYETILPHHTRKIYFDVDADIDIDGPELITILKEAIISKLGKDITILVFTSHTASKLSYHIVVPNYALKDEKALLNFYQQILPLIPEKYQPYMDSSVYKNTQQFRMLGSHKYEKDNLKIISSKLSYNFKIPKRYVNQQARLNYIFYISLITYTTDCTILREYDVKENKRKSQIVGTASEGDIDDVLDLFYTDKNFSYDDFTFLSVLENNGNLIVTMRRQNPSYCPACKRIHENENPFLLVKGIERKVIYYCRRNNQDKYLLGELGQYHLPEVSISDVPLIEKLTETEKNDQVEQLASKKQKSKPKYKAKVDFHGLNLSMY